MCFLYHKKWHTVEQLYVKGHVFSLNMSDPDSWLENGWMDEASANLERC